MSLLKESTWTIESRENYKQIWQFSYHVREDRNAVLGNENGIITDIGAKGSISVWTLQEAEQPNFPRKEHMHLDWQSLGLFEHRFIMIVVLKQIHQATIQ